MMTPIKSPHASRPASSESCKVSENINPNLSGQSPLQKPAKSPAQASVKSKKSAQKNPTKTALFQNNIQERKFVVAKKNSKKATGAAGHCKCSEKNKSLKKCPCIAFEALRASQEDFFRTRGGGEEQECDTNESVNGDCVGTKGVEDDRGSQIAKGLEEGKEIQGFGSSENESEVPDPEEFDMVSESGSTMAKKIKNKLMEEARNSIPKPGSGRVMHLVKAFETILALPTSSAGKEGDKTEERKKVEKWALPGLIPKAVNTDDVPSSSFLPGNLFFASKNFDADSRASIDSNSHGSIGSRMSSESRRSRRSSSESTGRHSGKKWEKQLKVTSQKPFKLRTEQRGRLKREEFHKKVEEMIIEENKLRIPMAQGLPWTTDEPECLVKPQVKESTKPIDLLLHSDVRAVERAEFDYHVSEKLSLMEQYRLERERLQKLEEEEEVRRLRKELVPKAQPMPYFDRPFIPKRSMKHPTIPKGPKFHIPQNKKIKCMSWNDINNLYHQQH